MLVQEIGHQRRFVGAEVVEDDMDLPIRRLGGDHFTQGRDKLLAGMTRGGLANHFAGLRVQRGRRNSQVSATAQVRTGRRADGERSGTVMENDRTGDLVDNKYVG